MADITRAPDTAPRDTAEAPGGFSTEGLAEYLAAARRAKLRRLAGIGTLCALLLVLLVVIYANDWFELTGGGSSGTGWLIVGVVIIVCAVGAMLIDLTYRKEL